MSSRSILACCFALSLITIPSVVHADVRKEGDWTGSDPTVSLSLREVSQRKALMKLADEAGWSVVVPSEIDESIDVEINDAPASKAIEMILDEGNFVAYREGNRIRVRRDSSKVTSASTVPASNTNTPAEPPTAPPIARGADRHYTGESIVVRAGDVVHDVSVLRGTLTIDGTATGNVEVIGGDIFIHPTAVVLGRVSSLGGDVHIDEGARVDGEIRAVGGKVDRRGRASAPASVPVSVASSESSSGVMSTLSHAVSETGRAISSSAILFVFGTVLIALVGQRMEQLKLEAAARPMRSFALGVVGALGGLGVFIALCVTILGIPVALVGLFLGFLAAYAGVCAVLQTGGELLLRQRTTNPYVHLAAGCAIFLVLGALPWVGSWVQAIVMLMGLGTTVALLMAQRQQRRGLPMGPEPYRTTAL